MNWDAVGAIAELFAAIGALAALIYLALQLRHNTEALRKSELAARSATSFQGAHSWAELNTAILDPEFAMLAAKSMDSPPSEINDDESARLNFLVDQQWKDLMLFITSIEMSSWKKNYGKSV